jgi:hypothetical protein
MSKGSANTAFSFNTKNYFLLQHAVEDYLTVQTRSGGQVEENRRID